MTTPRFDEHTISFAIFLMDLGPFEFVSFSLGNAEAGREFISLPSFFFPRLPANRNFIKKHNTFTSDNPPPPQISSRQLTYFRILFDAIPSSTPFYSTRSFSQHIGYLSCFVGSILPLFGIWGCYNFYYIPPLVLELLVHIDGKKKISLTISLMFPFHAIRPQTVPYVSIISIPKWGTDTDGWLILRLFCHRYWVGEWGRLGNQFTEGIPSQLIRLCAAETAARNAREICGLDMSTWVPGACLFSSVRECSKQNALQYRVRILDYE